MIRTADEDLLLEWGAAADDGRRPVPLLDDDPPRQRRRPPGRDLLVVGGGLAAVVVTLSLLGGDDGNRGEPVPPTSTTAPAARHPVVADRSPRTAELPAGGDQLVLGPLLPEPTGGTVLAALHRGDLRFVEIDTGRVRTFADPVPERVWGMVDVPGGVLLSGPAGLTLVSADGTVVWKGAAVDERALDLRAPHLVVATDDPAVFWVGQGGRLVERRVDGSSGRVIEAPPALFPEPWFPPTWPIVWVEPGFVVGASGTLVLVDADGGPNRVVGHGVPVAGTGRTLVRMACAPDLACRFHLTDVVTGDDRQVEQWEGPPVGWSFGSSGVTARSPDGRRVIVPLGTSTGDPALGVIDLVTAELHVLPLTAPTARPVFSADGRWLFLLGDASPPLHAVRLATGDVVDIPVDLATDVTGPVGMVRVRSG